MIGPFFVSLIYLLIRIPYACLIAVWFGVQQTIINDAVDQWREHLHCCVKANSRHFKPLQ